MYTEQLENKHHYMMILQTAEKTIKEINRCFKPELAKNYKRACAMRNAAFVELLKLNVPFSDLYDKIRITIDGEYYDFFKDELCRFIGEDEYKKLTASKTINEVTMEEVQQGMTNMFAIDTKSSYPDPVGTIEDAKVLLDDSNFMDNPAIEEHVDIKKEDLEEENRSLREELEKLKNISQEKTAKAYEAAHAAIQELKTEKTEKERFQELAKQWEKKHYEAEQNAEKSSQIALNVQNELKSVKQESDERQQKIEELKKRREEAENRAKDSEMKRNSLEALIKDLEAQKNDSDKYVREMETQKKKAEELAKEQEEKRKEAEKQIKEMESKLAEAEAENAKDNIIKIEEAKKQAEEHYIEINEALELARKQSEELANEIKAARKAAGIKDSESTNEELEKLRELAFKDKMCDIKNKNAFNKEFKEFEKDKTVFAMIAICYMKDINDEFGRQVGDATIKRVAESLVEQFGKDNVYRIIGDQFAVATMELTFGKVKNMLTRVINQLAVENIKIAYGVASGDRYNTLKEVVANAEEHMNKAKEFIHSADKTEVDKSTENTQIEKDLIPTEDGSTSNTDISDEEIDYESLNVNEGSSEEYERAKKDLDSPNADKYLSVLERGVKADSNVFEKYDIDKLLENSDSPDEEDYKDEINYEELDIFLKQVEEAQ